MSSIYLERRLVIGELRSFVYHQSIVNFSVVSFSVINSVHILSFPFFLLFRSVQNCGPMDSVHCVCQFSQIIFVLTVYCTVVNIDPCFWFYHEVIFTSVILLNMRTINLDHSYMIICSRFIVFSQELFSHKPMSLYHTHTYSIIIFFKELLLLLFFFFWCCMYG